MKILKTANYKKIAQQSFPTLRRFVDELKAGQPPQGDLVSIEDVLMMISQNMDSGASGNRFQDILPIVSELANMQISPEMIGNNNIIPLAQKITQKIGSIPQAQPQAQPQVQPQRVPQIPIKGTDF